MTNHVVVSSHGQRARRFALVFALSITGFILGFDLLVLWVGDGAFASVGNLKFVLFLAAFIGACGLFQLHRLSGDGQKVARLLGGTVVVLAEVDAQGNPVDVRVVERSGERDLDRAAVNAVRQWRFEPAMRNGKAIATSVKVPVDFKPI